MQSTLKIRWRWFGTTIILVIVGSILYATNIYLYLVNIIRAVINSNVIIILFWLLSLSICLSYYFTVAKEKEDSKILIRAFGPFLDSILSGFTYGALIQTSIVILRGLFNQLFFREVHFNGFSTWDLSIVGILMAYLLYWSLMNLYKMGADAFIVSDVGEMK